MQWTVLPAGETVQGVSAPYPLIEVPGRDTMALVAQMRGEGAGVPIILGSSADVALVFDDFDASADTADSILLRAHQLDLKAWLAQVERSERASNAEDNLPWPPRGIWPDPVPVGRLPAHIPWALFDPKSGQMWETAFVALLPCGRAAEAPAFMRFGDWNACPAPEVHIAIARAWAERYGASLLALSSRTAAFEVARPVTSRSDALNLATDMYLYCNDVVDRGYGTIDGLAASLMDAKLWQFFWT